jgi:DNA-binding transcriptional MerR regulator
VRIGALSQRTGVSVRMLRHYEQQGLLQPVRGANGYREYQEADVARAQLVSSLIRSGLPTRLIAVLLDERSAAAGQGQRHGPGLEEVFAAELARLDTNITCMTHSRDTIQRYLARRGGQDQHHDGST